MEELLNSDPIKKQLAEKGISRNSILRQLSQFERGDISVELIRPATINDGIVKINERETDEFINIYGKSLQEIEAVKFVPASGAASRMFKDLLSEYSSFSENENPDLKKYEYSKKLIENLPDFGFYNDLKSVCDSKNFTKIIQKLLFPGGLNYSNLPKGLIKFHKYSESSRTAFEEHLVESQYYIKGNNNRCMIHFTIPVESKSIIENYLSSIQASYEDTETFYNLSYSVQDPSTDTIAVDMKNNPVISKTGKLNFRPAGHGALIQNLNMINSDMIYIKNIDNVTVESYLDENVKYKKLLGGYLIFIKEKIHNYLRLLESGNADKEELTGIKEFLKKYLFIEIKDNTDLKAMLNRPIRVCGVVKNEGEPGGGPFWIKYGKSGESLQIVESAQVDISSDTQAAIWNSSTHFNPVDIVCWVRDYKDDKFDLNKYVDSDAGIITKKSADGVEIKALELPGLWNGAMADWLTVFIEVPLLTFNPVKTVFDLLRKEHQV
ncbi:MAG: DUF4301 family protein [Thermodesulfobacteriota bacterium]